MIQYFQPISFRRNSIGLTLIGCWTIISVFCILSVLVRPVQRFNRDTLRFEDSGVILIEAPALKIVKLIVMTRINILIRGTRLPRLPYSVSHLRDEVSHLREKKQRQMIRFVIRYS